jgi:hypothetical protein
VIVVRVMFVVVMEVGRARLMITKDVLGSR